MKTVTIQLGTKHDKGIVHILKVDTLFYGVVEKSTFLTTKMFPKAGPNGLPIATNPSNCLCIWLKLNSTPRVAITINSLEVS